jgi:hypothetical protein
LLNASVYKATCIKARTNSCSFMQLRARLTQVMVMNALSKSRAKDDLRKPGRDQRLGQWEAGGTIAKQRQKGGITKDSLNIG